MNLLPPKLAAKKCGVAKSTFYQWSKKNGFPPARVTPDGRRFWLDADLDVWLERLPRAEPQQ